MFLLMFAFTREREREGENILGKRTDIENQSFEAHFIANKKGKEKGFQHLHDLYFLYTNGWGGLGQEWFYCCVERIQNAPKFVLELARSFLRRRRRRCNPLPITLDDCTVDSGSPVQE